jgi:hypothetical protein
MTKFTDNLWSDLAREHGATLAQADRPEPGRVRRLRPRALAGSTLGLAGVGAALVLVLGGSTASPAFAITQKDNGTVFVKINFGGQRTLMAADQTLIAKYHETAVINIAAGPATTEGPVNCTPTPDPYAPGDASPTGPTVTILLGSDGTGTIPSGDTGAGTVHLSGCQTYVSYPHSNTGSGNSGNSGNS